MYSSIVLPLEFLHFYNKNGLWQQDNPPTAVCHVSNLPCKQCIIDRYFGRARLLK